LRHTSKYGTTLRHTQFGNVSIEELKIVSRIGSNETAPRYTAIKNKEKLLERLDRPILDIVDHSYKIHKTTDIGTLF
jgi:hypothetical protein